MTKKTRNDSSLVLCSAWLVLSFLLVGCGGENQAGGGGTIDVDAGPIEGCFAELPPAEEPDLVLPPVFADEIVLPGTVIEGDFRVDGETRTVIVELAEYWELDDPPSGTEQRQTPGNQTLSFAFPTVGAPRGRYFFRITLCANDCALARVLFTLAPDPERPNLRSDYYQRIVFEGNTEVGSAATCLDADSIVVQ